MPIGSLAAVGTLVAALGGLGIAESWGGAGRAGAPNTIDGVPVMSVAEVLTAESEQALTGTDVGVRGYWSDRLIPHGCSAATAGEWELRCHDGEFGITELDEPILSLDPAGRVTEATGPHLTPWFTPDLAEAEQLFTLPIINGQRYPPVPIIVIGHFHDPRAALCQADARALCEARLVVTRIVSFDWKNVGTPAPTAVPTPFPSPAPAGLFDPRAAGICAGDVEYSFIGWTTTTELGLSFHRDGHVWAAITASAVPLGEDDWTMDADSSEAYRVWGRRVCLAEEYKPQVILYGAVPGTTYREFRDGTRTPVEVP